MATLEDARLPSLRDKHLEEAKKETKVEKKLPAKKK
jgi:hypothetical protein